jgi:hypothetical protein
VGPLDRRGVLHDAVEPVVRPGEAGRALGPERPRDLERLLQALEADRGRLEIPPAVGLVLPLVPAGAEAQDRAPAADQIERRRHLDRHRGVAVGHTEDELAEADAPGDRRDRAQRGEAFQHRLGDRVAGVAAFVEEVVVEPERVEACLVDGPRDALHGVPRVPGRAGRVRIDLQAELHRLVLPGVVLATAAARPAGGSADGGMWGRIPRATQRRAATMQRGGIRRRGG